MTAPTEGRPTVAERLRHAATTATNDDMSELRSEKRARHIERVDAMLAAAALLDQAGEALRTALPYIDNSDSPGGCDGKQPECEHCDAIRKVRNALAALNGTPVASLEEPSGVENLKAILADQPYQNSVFTVAEIQLILENTGGFMPDEATIWFREWRAGSPKRSIPQSALRAAGRSTEAERTPAPKSEGGGE